MKEIFLHKEDIPTRCDSCPFLINRCNDNDTAKLDYICMARDSRIPIATLYYTDSMYWKDKKCPLQSIDQDREKVENKTVTKFVQKLRAEDERCQKKYGEGIGFTEINKIAEEYCVKGRTYEHYNRI